MSVASWIEAEPRGSVLRVFVQPKASRSECVGPHGEGGEVRLKVRVAAPPVDGEANAELVRFLRKALKPAGVREVVLVRGETGRRKDVLLVGGDPAAVRRTLGFGD